MNFQSKYWTYLIVSLVTVLLWVWAAAETREEKTATFRVRFASAGAGNWVIIPKEIPLTVTLEGSRFALQEAQSLKQGSIVLTTGNELPSSVGNHTVNLTTALNKNEALRNTRVTVLAVDPPSKMIEIDALVAVTATVLPDLPHLYLDGEPEVDPAEVTVTLPSRLADLAPEEIAPRAYIAQSRLNRLEPGREYVLSTKLLLPEKLATEDSVTIEPPVANVTFTVRSFIEETILPTVRVHIAGPPEDHEEYLVEIDNDVLKDVTISADAVLIEQIKAGDAVVVAMVHLSLRDKEQRVESKPVTYFVALPANGAGGEEGQIVDATVGGSTEPPLIHLAITERVTEATP